MTLWFQCLIRWRLSKPREMPCTTAYSNANIMPKRKAWYCPLMTRRETASKRLSFHWRRARWYKAVGYAIRIQNTMTGLSIWSMPMPTAFWLRNRQRKLLYMFLLRLPPWGVGRSLWNNLYNYEILRQIYLALNINKKRYRIWEYPMQLAKAEDLSWYLFNSCLMFV